jgi:hypothetical protein
MEKKVLMLATVLALLCLVLVTPLFLGYETSSPSAIPELLIDHAEEETRIYVQGAVEAIKFTSITIEVRDKSDGGDWNNSVSSNNTISLSMYVRDEDTTHFHLNVTVVRGEMNHTYDCIIQVDQDLDGEILKIHLPDEEEPIIYKEEDFPFEDVISEELKTE